MEDRSSLVGGMVDRFVERLRKEVALWRQEGIVDEATAQRIMGRYGEAYEQQLKVSRQGRLTHIIVTLGAILVGAGVLLFVSANWQTIPTAFKLLIIFSSIGTAYGSGMWLDSIGYDRTGKALMFLGVLLYGAGIALIAQIYHIQANSGSLFLLWGIGALATGVALRSQFFIVFASILFGTWSFFSRFGPGRGFFFFDVFDVIGTFKPVYHWPYLVILAGLIALAYWWRKEVVLAVNLIGFGMWMMFALTNWDIGGQHVIVFYLIFGIFFMLLAALHREVLKVPHSFAVAYSLLGAATILVTNYILSFNAVLNEISRSTQAVKTPYWITLGVLVAASIIGSISILLMPRFIPFIRYGFLGLAGLVVFALMYLLFPFMPASATDAYNALGYYREAFNPYMPIWNILLAAEIVSLIVLGYVTNERRYVNMGLLFFAVLVITRYFDTFSLYFGTYGAFIGGGVLLILLGFFLERFRRQLLKSMEGRTMATVEEHERF